MRNMPSKNIIFILIIIFVQILRKKHTGSGRFRFEGKDEVVVVAGIGCFDFRERPESKNRSYNF